MFLCRILLYKGKFIPIGRKGFRETLMKGRRQSSPIILLPPYISIHELRLMLNVNYETCFKAANVYKHGNKYTWRDSENRIFQSVNKRNVIIPYSVAAYVSKIFKFKPRLIEMEITCEEKKDHEDICVDLVYKQVYELEENKEEEEAEEEEPIVNTKYKNKTKSNENQRKIQKIQPVVSVIGHINHGKTTFLDKITNNQFALLEPGSITQHIRAIHFEGSNQKEEQWNCTFLDTPGHEVFQIFRGRASFISDIIIILISLEVGAEIQTEECIKYADQCNVPVIFVLNKFDIYPDNVSVVRAELKNQCTKMFDKKELKHDYSREIDHAICVSALTGYNVKKLIRRIYFLSKLIPLPYHNANYYCTTSNLIERNQENEKPEKIESNYKIRNDANLLEKYIRKSDCLLALNHAPFGIGIVMDISKDSSKGTILNAVIKNGFFMEGQYFICGSAYGRIRKMYKYNTDFKEYCPYATTGMAVQISGIRKHGNATSDDLIYTLPQNNAFRFCQYRLMVEKLATLQVSGKEIKVSWENDMRKNEFLAEHIYQNRMYMSEKRKAIEEFGVPKDKIFKDVSMEEFHKSNTQLRKEEQNMVEIELEEEEPIPEELKIIREEDKKRLQKIALMDDNTGSILVKEEKDSFVFFGSSKEKQNQNEKHKHISEIAQRKQDIIIEECKENKEHLVNKEGTIKDANVHDEQNRILTRGRKSNKYKNKDHSDYTTKYYNQAKENRDPQEEKTLHEPWYYEENEENWAKKVLQRNEELREKWRGKTRQREIEQERQQLCEKQMILQNEIMKRNLLGEEKLTEEEIQLFLNDKLHKNTNREKENHEKVTLPEKNCPVIPIIIRTSYLGMFDIFLEEFEKLQKEYNVKVSVVHGGIGPITPNDVIHAEVENEFGYCCIYAFQVKVLPDSVKQALLSKVVIKQFDVFTDLLDDVVKRITNIKTLIRHNMYVRSLKTESTEDGF